MQGELEKSLERLNKVMERQCWVDNLDLKDDGTLIMGERFFTFKAKVIDLTKIVEGHFNKIISDIMHGLPEVEEIEEEKDSNL